MAVNSLEPTDIVCQGGQNAEDASLLYTGRNFLN